jgi:hypothetical protein
MRQHYTPTDYPSHFAGAMLAIAIGVTLALVLFCYL